MIEGLLEGRFGELKALENLQFQVKADSSLPYLRYLFSSCEPASYFAIFISMIFLLK